MTSLSGECCCKKLIARWCLWAICMTGKAQWNKCTSWWEFLSIFSYGCIGAVWHHSSLHCWIIFQLYLWSWPLVRHLAASLYVCLYIFLLENTSNGHLNKYFIVYILNIMFLFDNKYCFKWKLVFMIFVSWIVCVCWTVSWHFCPWGRSGGRSHLGSIFRVHVCLASALIYLMSYFHLWDKVFSFVTFDKSVVSCFLLIQISVFH